MPLTPDPYEIENAPDAAATVVEGNETNYQQEEGI